MSENMYIEVNKNGYLALNFKINLDYSFLMLFE